MTGVVVVVVPVVVVLVMVLVAEVVVLVTDVVVDVIDVVVVVREVVVVVAVVVVVVAVVGIEEEREVVMLMLVRYWGGYGVMVVSERGCGAQVGDAMRVCWDTVVVDARADVQ